MLGKCACLVFGLGCGKDGAPNSESFDFLRTSSITNCLPVFLNISLCTFVTVYGSNPIGLAFYFNSKSTGSVFHVPSVPWNKYLRFCKRLSKYFHWSSVKFCHLFFITLFKPDFSYLVSNTIPNRLLELWAFSVSKLSYMYASVKYSFCVIFSKFYCFNLCAPKSNMGDVHLSNGLPRPLMMCLEDFKFNLNSISRSYCIWFQRSHIHYLKISESLYFACPNVYSYTHV